MSYSPSSRYSSGPLSVNDILGGTQSGSLSASLNIDGIGNLVVGQVGSCSSGQTHYGIETGIDAVSASLNIISSRESGPNNISLHSIADVNAASLDNDHILFRLSWKNDEDHCSGSWNFKKNSFETVESSSIELVGTEEDGGSSVGVYLGTLASYVTPGAKLVSVLNNTTEREYIDYAGNKRFGITDYGGYVEEKYWSEAITPISGAYTDTINVIPAGASAYAVSVRVTNRIPFSGSTSFPVDSKMRVGISASVGSFTEKWGEGIDTTEGSTNLTSSLKSGLYYVSENTPIRLKFDNYVSDTSASFGSGSVRVEVRYRQVNPPTS